MRTPKIDREYVEIYPVNWDNITQEMVNKIFITRSFEKLDEISLYVHIPFCPQICPFCKFNVMLYSHSLYKEYIKALKKEISFYRGHPDVQNRKVTVIFFGGGTASMLIPEDVAKLLNLIRDIFHTSKDTEITIECHPNTISKEKLQCYKDMGVNRITIGVQSFQDENLKAIGRNHTAKHNEEILHKAIDMDFDKVSIDLMYRLPHQSFENLKYDLEKVKEFLPDSISAYSLEPEARPLEEKLSEMPGGKMDQKMFYYIGDFLKELGYHRFTQPDFSKPNKECKYVLNAWEAPQQLLLGFGAGAHTHYFGGYVWANIYPVKKYIELIDKGYFPGIMGSLVSKEELMAKYLVLGVRHLNVNKMKFKDMFGVGIEDQFSKPIEELLNYRWIENDGEKYIITRRGLWYIDNVSKKFYSKANIGKKQPWCKNLYNFVPHTFYKIKEV